MVHGFCQIVGLLFRDANDAVDKPTTEFFVNAVAIAHDDVGGETSRYTSVGCSVATSDEVGVAEVA